MGLASAWAGACVGQHGWNNDFANHMYQCGLESVGQQPAAGVCMARKQHVSAACGKCMGDLIHCGMQCISECCLGHCPHSNACRTCNAQKCNPSFFSCAGVNPARRLAEPSDGDRVLTAPTAPDTVAFVPNSTSNSTMLASAWAGACV